MLILAGAIWINVARKREYWRVAYRQVIARRMPMICFGLLCCYALVGMLDTLHFRRVSNENPTGGNIESLLDVLCDPLVRRTEKTYSAPFATRAFSKETILLPDGTQVREFPPLDHAGSHLADRDDTSADIRERILKGLLWGLFAGVLFTGLSVLPAFVWPMEAADDPIRKRRARIVRGLWIGGFLTFVSLCVAEAIILSKGYHIFGTDKTGQDVFYLALKGARTGLVIGTLTTLIVTPFAILFGVLAGYMGGRVDDLIQYVYTTLSSIPDILLIAAAMIILQVGLRDEETAVSADRRLVYLCFIMGITSWTGLCRLIRAEVLKLREVEFVQAADAFGIGRMQIMARHLVPNVMHLVLISVVLQFSGLVLAEAVLAYVGIGVDPSMQSWGNMINQARLELARDPVVWWSLLAAFVFMLGLVLPANLFGDAVRDALDPRLRTR
ncbi:MAG: ABC transporter permease [Planctomycetes bacterium]|nr:ABC transporter permease [Planctomycetota bacterium]